MVSHSGRRASKLPAHGRRKCAQQAVGGLGALAKGNHRRAHARKRSSDKGRHPALALCQRLESPGTNVLKNRSCVEYSLAGARSRGMPARPRHAATTSDLLVLNPADSKARLTLSRAFRQTNFHLSGKRGACRAQEGTARVFAQRGGPAPRTSR